MTLIPFLLAAVLVAAPAPRMAEPYVHVPAASVQALCAAGEAQGARANVFAKVGDSITAYRGFMADFADPGLVNLGGNQYLGPTVIYYRSGWARTGTSFDDQALGALGGVNAAGLLSRDLAWLQYGDTCKDQTLLECEYNYLHPAVSLIMVGTNNPAPDLGFEYDLGSIVQQTVDRGIVPILFTIPPNAFKDVTPYNDHVRIVAAAFDVPLVDYEAAMRGLPAMGLSPDGVHPSEPPDGNTAALTAVGLTYGYPMRNLLALDALAQVHTLCK